VTGLPRATFLTPFGNHEFDRLVGNGLDVGTLGQVFRGATEAGRRQREREGFLVLAVLGEGLRGQGERKNTERTVRAVGSRGIASFISKDRINAGARMFKLKFDGAGSDVSTLTRKGGSGTLESMKPTFRASLMVCFALFTVAAFWSGGWQDHFTFQREGFDRLEESRGRIEYMGLRKSGLEHERAGEVDGGRAGRRIDQHQQDGEPVIGSRVRGLHPGGGIRVGKSTPGNSTDSNSGVKMMNIYEVQIFDSYGKESRTSWIAGDLQRNAAVGECLQKARRMAEAGDRFSRAAF